MSTGADTVYRHRSRVYQTQFLLLINAQLVPTALSPRQGRHSPIWFGTWWKEEANAAGNQHVPDAVDVKVVFLRLNKGVEGHSRTGDEGSWAEVEEPSLPCWGVTVAPPDRSECLTIERTCIIHNVHNTGAAVT